MRALTVVIALLCCTGVRAGSLDVTALATRLGHNDISRGDFTQQHMLPFLTHPLTSTGHFLYARGHGVSWVVEQPVQASITVAADGGVCASDPGVDSGRAASVVARLVGAMLSGDLAALRDWFDVSADGTGNAWTVTLKPNRDALARIIDSITLHGNGADPARIDVHERSGGTTRIDLHNLTHPATLSQASRKELSCGDH